MKSLPEKVIMFTPAYNAEMTVENVVGSALTLLREKVIHDFVVVDDGSTDRTAEVARKMGAKVISLGKNLGKGRAFLEGALYCRKNGASVLVTIDADLISGLSPAYLQSMLSALKAKDEASNPYLMVIAPACEWDRGPQWRSSGQRAIKMKALNFLFAETNGKVEFNSAFGAKRFVDALKRYPFGLEVLLDRKIEPKTFVEAHVGRLKFLEALRRGENRQLLQINGMTAELGRRDQAARSLLLERNGMKVFDLTAKPRPIPIKT